jgi:hypothetical protein
MQYALDILHQQEQRQEAPLDQIHHQPPLAPQHNQVPNQPPPPQAQNYFFHYPPSPSQIGTIDPKSPLAEHLQLTPWPLHYRAVPPPKYHGNTDPCKFLMCYEATTTSARGDKATLTKSLIISLDDATMN